MVTNKELKLKDPIEYDNYKRLYKLMKEIKEEDYINSNIMQKKKFDSMSNLVIVIGFIAFILFIGFMLMFAICMYWKYNYYEVNKMSVSVCKDQCNKINQTYIQTMYKSNELICSCDKRFIVLGETK